MGTYGKYVKRATSQLKYDADSKPIDDIKIRVRDAGFEAEKRSREALADLYAQFTERYTKHVVEDIVNELDAMLLVKQVPPTSPRVFRAYSRTIAEGFAEDAVDEGWFAEDAKVALTVWLLNGGVVQRVIQGVAARGWFVAADQTEEIAVWAMKMPRQVVQKTPQTPPKPMKPKKRPPKQHHKRK